MSKDLINKLKTDLSYSVRRYFVDDFFLENISVFPINSIILDMGGKKKNKRGIFNIGEYNLIVKYANIDSITEPDYFCDILSIPVADNSFDGVILSEVLEHLSEPLFVLKEAYRVLKPGGKLLIVTPFMFHVHADPYDYARYTDYWYQKSLNNIGFTDIQISKQGHIFSVIGNLIKLFVYELHKAGKPKNKMIRKLFHKFVSIAVRKCLIWDDNDFIKSNVFLSANTTGFGVICEK